MNNTTTFWTYLNENKIEIPIIQRDYAQGRIGKEELRKSFLGDLKNALDENKTQQLDFVYGSTQNGKINPLDGQQRLTTLWLLHWYIALKAEKLDKVRDILNRFTYETRVSSREFIQRLCEYKNNPKNGKLVSDIQNQTWFYSEWKQDPTIQSMLRMLSGTTKTDKTGTDIIDGIEELFKDTPTDESTNHFNDYWEKLTEQNGKKCPIVFYSLNLGELKLTDDLYIKMNARGEQLTSFENFKADLIGYIKAKAEEPNSTWKSLSAPNDGIPIKMDTTWTDIFWKNKSKDNKIDEIYFAFLNRYFLNTLITEKENDTTYKLKSNEIENDKRKGVFEKEKAYSSFEYYKFDKSVFDNLKKTLDNFAAFLIASEPKKIEEIQKLFYPAWEDNSDFRFIPKYAQKDHKETISTLTQPQTQRVVFFAICKYFENCEYEEKSFKQWMRVVWNLVENDTAGWIGCMRLIDELSKHSHDIYKFLAGNESINSTANKDQVAEERAKAKKILEDKTWEDCYKEAEKFRLLKGKVSVLMKTKDGCDATQEEFKQKLELLKTLLENQEDKYHLVKVLLSYYNYGGKYLVLKLKRSRANWKKLITEDLTECVKEITEEKKNENISQKWISDLVKTKLLNNSRDDRSQSKTLVVNGNDVTLFGTDGCTWNSYGNVILGDEVEKRNSVLSNLCDSKTIDSNQRISNCDFFWGRDIDFKYQGQSFQWNSRDEKIYLMKGEIIDKSISFNGNNMTEVDFVNKLKGLINSTNNPEKSI